MDNFSSMRYLSWNIVNDLLTRDNFVSVSNFGNALRTVATYGFCTESFLSCSLSKINKAYL